MLALMRSGLNEYDQSSFDRGMIGPYFDYRSEQLS
jgi:hypothetical protein